MFVTSPLIPVKFEGEEGLVAKGGMDRSCNLPGHDRSQPPPSPH